LSPNSGRKISPATAMPANIASPVLKINKLYFLEIKNDFY
jgi:hypothetical protein